jgi:hypothetical protein
MNRLTPFLVLAALAVGCASDPSRGTGSDVWYNPQHTSETPQNQPARDLATCRMNGVNTGTALSGYNAGSFIASAMANDGRKKEFVQNCMIANGYLRVRQSLVPAGVPFVKE